MRGRRLGVDVGKVRVGVAMSDPDGILATPLETVQRDLSGKAPVPTDIARIGELVDENMIVEVVVGLPVRLQGDESFAAQESRAYASLLEGTLSDVPVQFCDERLTTAMASRRLAERGVKGKRRKAVVDQAAAVEILQQWLDRRRKALFQAMLDELPFEADDSTKPKGHRRKRGGRTGLTFVLVLVLLGTLGVAGWYGFDKVKGFFVAADYEGDGNGTVVQVEVPEGASLQRIGGVLYNAGVVKSPDAFVEAAQESPEASKIQPGTYKLEEEMSGKAAVTAMLHPSARGTAELNVAAGLTMWRTFETLSASTGIPVEKFEEAAKDPSELGVPDEWFEREDDKDGEKTIEGFLFPGTYEFDPGSSAKDMLTQMVSRFLDHAEETDFVSKVEDLEFDISPYQALIVASLAQGEASASRPEDMSKVGRVVYNRLYEQYYCHSDLTNCLEFDSALNYGLVLAGGEHTDSKDLTSEQLADKSNEFNTHVYPGLTPTPINSPGKAALNGAVEPEKGDWVFFVTVKKDGTTKFADTSQKFEEYLDEACENGVTC